MVSASNFPEALVGSFSLAPAEILDSHISLYNILADLTLSLSATQIYMVKKWCWFSKSKSSMRIFQVGSMFSFLPASLISSTYTGKKSPLTRLTKNIPSLKLFPNHVPKELSQIAFHIRVLPKVIHTDSFREERLGLPYWTMILAICVVVDESKCLDTPIWEFSIICEHLPFWAEYKRILHLLLVHRNPAIWRWYPWSWRLSFEMLMILVQWILRKTLNHLLQCHLGVRLYAFVFLTLRFQLRNLKMTEIHPWRKTIFSALRLWFIDHFFLVSDYRQPPCRIFSPVFSHYFSTAAFCIWNF